MNLHNMKLESVYAKGEDGEFHLVARRDECEKTATAEKDYIEREKALDAVFGQFCASSDETEAALNAAIEEIRETPAADVRPVVLCRECKMQQSCKVAQYLGKDGFCSNGEKDVRSLEKCKLYKDCEYRTIWNCCCEDCNIMVE